MDEQLKSQQTANRSVLTPQATTATPTTPTTPAPTIIRRVQNPDGTISIIRTTMSAPNQPGTPHRIVAGPSAINATPTNTNVIQPGTKKVFMTKDGKIIGAQLVQTNTPAVSATPPGKITIPTVGGVQNPAATPTIVQPQPQAQPVQPQPQQKVQIVRSSDGKIQVRGLLPGQQLVQMPDGKLQIFSQPTAQQPQATPTPQPVAPPPPPQPTVTPVQPPTSVMSSQPSRIVVHPSGQSTTVPGPPANVTPTKPPAAAPKSIVATPLQPGQAIPPGTTVFMSGGKTYCIPKASMALATQQAQQPATPAPPPPATPSLPVTPVPPQQLESSPQAASTPPNATPTCTPTIGTVQAQSSNGQKQMVEVKSLGQNSVTFKGNQMIVSGPDITAAQNIAKQLSSGAAKLATLNGKQVLISTQPTVMNKPGGTTPGAANVVTPAAAAPSNTVTVPNVPTEIPNNVKLPSEPLPLQSAIKQVRFFPDIFVSETGFLRIFSFSRPDFHGFFRFRKPNIFFRFIFPDFSFLGSDISVLDRIFVSETECFRIFRFRKLPDTGFLFPFPDFPGFLKC